MSSKIKVDTIENVAGSGNVSLGSGHNLVVPGTLAITGASTLTGATTVGGDFTVDTSTLKVDSSNNRVGIGTASPTQDLTIVNSGSARMELVSGTSGTSIIDMGDSADKDIGGIRYAQGTDTMQFRAGNDVRMSIDGSGRVTKPANPAFSVRSTAGNNGNTWEAGQDIKFQVVDTDIGSNYATGTGRFTAPVAGFYTFSYIGFGYSAGRVPAGSTCSVQLRKNGSTITTGSYNEVNSSTGYPQSGFTFSLALAVNDYVTIRAQANGQYADSSGLYTALSGYLVG